MPVAVVADTTVRAPFLAMVKERMVNVGQYVRPNTPLFTLVKTDPIRLRIEAPERMAQWIKIGQTAEVALEAFPGRTFSGRVWRISPTVEQSKRTFVVEALIPNGSGELKPGFYAKARVHTDKTDHIRLAPVTAKCKKCWIFWRLPKTAATATGKTVLKKIPSACAPDRS